MDVFAVHFGNGLADARHPVRSNGDLHHGSVRAIVQLVVVEPVRKLSHPLVIDPPVIELTPFGSDGRVENVHGQASQAGGGFHGLQLLKAETEEFVHIEASSSIFRLVGVGLSNSLVNHVCSDVIYSPRPPREFPRHSAPQARQHRAI